MNENIYYFVALKKYCKKKMNCPLCQSTQISIVEHVNKNDLVFLNKKLTQKDFSYLINQDLDLCECANCKLKFFVPMIVGDENFYNTLQKYDWYYSDIKKEFEVAQKYIKTTDKVLEVGSGKGNFAKYLNTANYIGLDFSQEAKRMAAENGIKIENDSIEDFSEKNMENFDVVASFQVLEHVKNPDKFIEAKLKALKKGGKLIFAVPNDGSFVGKVSNHALNMPPHHVSRWNRATFEFIAQKYHLKILAIDCEQMQPPHIHWWLATKIQAFFLKPKLIDLSLKRKILSKFSFFIVKFLKFFVNRKKLPFGHTITVVFQK